MADQFDETAAGLLPCTYQCEREGGTRTRIRLRPEAFGEHGSHPLPHWDYASGHDKDCEGRLRDVVAAALRTEREQANEAKRWMVICPACHGQKSRDIETAAYSGHATCPDCGGTGRQFASTVIAQAEARGFARGVEASVKVVDERLVFWGMRYLVELLVERLRALIPKNQMNLKSLSKS